jgi:rhodanese-related sulfurtransferase
VHAGHHASYYPGAHPIHLKLLFSRPDGRVLGAQAVGREGVDRHINVVATMIQMDGTVADLAEVELCYAPQYGAARDPMNVAGMMACNVLTGDMPLASWADLGADGANLILDVREPEELAAGDSIDGALNIPLSDLRQRLPEVPRDREVWVICAAGHHAYFAQRLLLQRGYRARHLSGGYQTYAAMRQAGLLRRPRVTSTAEAPAP